MTHAAHSSPDDAPARKLPLKVWFVLGLLMSLVVLNYFDRQTLSILKPVVKAELDFDDTAYSLLTFTFMLPYIVMYVVSGRLIERFGTRICMTVFAIGWSIANIASGMSHSFAHLAASRALLGATEPGVFPIMQRAILNWVPVERRTLAISIVTPAGNIGAVLAPPLVALMATGIGWRAAFVIPGLVGIAIAIMWWFTDTRHAPRAEPEPEAPPADAAGEEAASATALLRDRRYWAIIAVRMISDPVWYFYLFWIPGYLQERVGLSLSELGLVGGLPYIVAIVSCMILGRTVDGFATRGHDPIRIQLRLFAITAALMPLGALITMTSSPAIALLIITVVITVCQAWFVGFNVLLAGLFPVKVNASAVGMLGAVGASTSLLLNLLAGFILAQFDYAGLLAGLAILHPISAVILIMVIGRSRAKSTARDTA
ncbi:MFS transporter [Sphingomonas colocasiae]|uniref:MFS transporter n=1 Tax=Sphingomonas colocasiae TaxID=1848973 RepID=A0ABS7PYF1_9SPHN|nr:MFS transporter [Sphingomonas colocasiae]MBY8826391.1 MFS transporter [Sphingomonas colocasiae]